MNIPELRTDKELRQELRSIVGEENVVDDVGSLGAYMHDNSPFPSVPPYTVAKPSSAEQVSNILRLVNRGRNQAIVRGGGMSLTGIIRSDPERTVVIDTTRLNKILEIDETNMVVRVECGTIMGDIERELEKKGMYVHTVTVPVNYVTVGGVLSGVVGGGLVPRRAVHGLGVNFVLGLKVVLPDGKILCTGAGGSNTYQKTDYIKGANGPDVLGLFIGDGGIFGVKVEATLQMFPEPMLKQSERRIFRSFSDSWNTFSKLMSLETLPFSVLRVTDRGEDFLLEYVVETSRSEILQLYLDMVARVSKENDGVEETEKDKEHSKRLPSISELRSEHFVRLPRYFISYMSGRKEFPFNYNEIKNFLLNEMATKHLEKKGVAVQMSFQPNMRNSIFCTFNIQFDPNVEESRSAVLSMGNRCYERLIEMGCCPQPHQGFGAEMMARHWSKEYREVMLGMKKLLDPNMVLNSSLWNLS